MEANHLLFRSEHDGGGERLSFLLRGPARVFPPFPYSDFFNSPFAHFSNGFGFGLYQWDLSVQT